MATTSEERAVSPPYVVFGTLKNFMESLKPSIPGRIDKSVMRGMAGGTQGHLMIALKFLGLIGANGEPTNELRQLVDSAGTDRWAEVLAATIKSAYADTIGDLDIGKATPKQVEERFKEQGLEGSTAEKAMRFYLAAIKDAKLEHSPHLQNRKSRAGIRRGGRKSSGGTPDRGAATPPAPEQLDDGKMMVVPIFSRGRAIGKIVVPFDITPEDCAMAKLAFQNVEAIANQNSGGAASGS